MFKSLLTIFSLMYLVPLTAHAWSLNTWAKTGGGFIVARDGPPQSSVNSSVYKNYTTSQPFTVSVTANPGYTISRVIYNTVTDTSGQTSYSVQGPNAQSVYAYFSAQPLTVTASADASGTAIPASLSNIYFGTILYSARKFTFTPVVPTAKVVSIAGVPIGATVSSALPAAAGTQVTVILPTGFTFSSNIALNATFFAPPTAKTVASQSVMLGNTTTLDGSSSLGSPDFYSWTQIFGPGFPATKAIADNTPGAQVPFTPAVAGVYKFALTVTGGSTASTTVTVYDDIVAFARTGCVDCHFAAGKGIASNVFGNWSSSGHKTKGIYCVQCHVGNDSGGHPGKLTKNSVSASTFDFNFASTGSGNFCVTCHSPAILTDFAVSKHSIRAGSASCSFCHVLGVHNPDAVCRECHKPENMYGLEWPPAAFTFHSSFTEITNVCKGCHTTHNPKILSIKTSCP